MKLPHISPQTNSTTPRPTPPRPPLRIFRDRAPEAVRQVSIQSPCLWGLGMPAVSVMFVLGAQETAEVVARYWRGVGHQLASR